MLRNKRTLLALFAITSLPVTGLAHHSHSTINKDDVRIYSGIVTKFGWTMPHVYLKIDGPDDEGNIVQYSVEMNHPPAMVRLGWARNTWQAGDRITWEGAHDKDPKRHFTALNWAEKGDGTRVGDTVGGEKPPVPSADFTGLWKRDDPGGFKPHYTPPEGWPLSALGQELVNNFDENQNPMVTCGNPGPPKSMIIPYPVQFSRPDDNTLVMERELMADLRIVHFDRNHPVGEPSKMGHSVGWFEDDTLVVETKNFIADKWGIHTGINSSAQKHLLERFSLANGGLFLLAEITVTDPVYLAEPVTFSHRWRKLSDRPIIQAPCTMEAARLYLEAGY
jgi:uncharacterized protein DUF6152